MLARIAWELTKAKSEGDGMEKGGPSGVEPVRVGSRGMGRCTECLRRNADGSSECMLRVCTASIRLLRPQWQS